MKKKYISPELDVIRLTARQLMTTSPFTAPLDAEDEITSPDGFGARGGYSFDDEDDE